MNKIIIDNKKYLVVPEKEFQLLQKRAVLKTKPEKMLTVNEARSHSKKLIRKWAGEK